MARIIVTSSSGEQTHELTPGQVVTIGRDPANRLPLPDEAGLSRRHCRIAPREGGDEGWEVADLGSTNKTRVGGQIVPSKVLVNGDVIEIGSVSIRFEDPEEEERLESLGKEGVCYLENVYGDHKGERIVLSRKRTTIGRRDANDVQLDDRMVSGHHSEIDRDLNGYTIRDLGSTNGTLVNGQPISEALLTHGARVRIGNYRFAFKDPSMKDVEVELAHFDEDDGWGMMGEIDLTRAHSSKAGILAVILLFLAAGAGGYMLSQQAGDKDAGTRGGARAGRVANGDFEQVDVDWSTEREEGIVIQREEKRGQPGAWLSAENSGDVGLGTAHVTYDDPIEISGARPLRFAASVRKKAGAGAQFIVRWVSDPTPEEVQAGVTALERTDILASPESGAWRKFETVIAPPIWARAAHLALRLPEGAGAGLDNVDVDFEAEADRGVTLGVRKFKSATIGASGTLDLLAGRTVLLTGMKPVVVLEDGEVLDTFVASGPAEATETSAALKGGFVGPDSELPATLTWTTTPEGLRAELECKDAKAVGFAAAAPAAHVGRTVSVLGDFPPQRVTVDAGSTLEKVARTLVGDPASGASADSTLIAFVQGDNAPVSTLTFQPSIDRGLVIFHHIVPDARVTIDLISDFTTQRRQADADLGAAKALMTTAPGKAIRALRNVAQAYPFDKNVRDEAVRLADELERKAVAQVQALAEALAAHEIYRSGPSLVRVEKLAAEVTEKFLGGASSGGGLESEAQELVDAVQAGRTAFDIRHATVGIDRLERIAALLHDSTAYKPMAALYWRVLLQRYEALAPDAPDIARRLDTARTSLDALEKIPEVREALPPVPGAP